MYKTTAILLLISLFNICPISQSRYAGRDYPSDLILWPGPEIQVSGASGYFDYQMNGIRFNHVYRHSSTVMYTVYMTSSDSLNYNSSRRTTIAFSADDGITWSDLGVYPGSTSGYPSISGKNDGSGVFTNIYSGGGHLNYDVGPGIGSFAGVSVPSIWPQVSRLSDGNMLVVGISAVTDSIAVTVFNSITNLVITTTELVPPVGLSGLQGMSLSSCTGPNGKAIILANPYLETGGNWGRSRIYCVQSSDYGFTWGFFTLLFNPHIISGDSIAPNRIGSCDIIMDASGNYYWAFNSLGPSSLYRNGRLLVGKNNTEPKIVAGTHTSSVNPIYQIPDEMTAQAFISNFDHPCLSLSDDGQYILVSYSVPFMDDTLHSFNKCHLFMQYAKTSDMVWSTPYQITPSGPVSYDERYASINRISAYNSTLQGYVINLVYQKDRQPGSFVIDGAPESKASLMYRQVLLTNPGGVKRIGNEIPKEFALLQNYPNPFNPVTQIKFDVPKRAFVEMVVYDIQGKEVSKLVQNDFDPGEYSVTWDGSNHASGVYYYTLKSNGYTQTKRMVLVK